jgi:hypothetical protein
VQPFARVELGAGFHVLLRKVALQHFVGVVGQQRRQPAALGRFGR